MLKIMKLKHNRATLQALTSRPDGLSVTGCRPMSLHSKLSACEQDPVSQFDASSHGL